MWPFRGAQYDVCGKVVIVTGALGAIGRRLAERLVESGAKVALVDIASDAAGQALCEELNGGSGQRVAAYKQVDLCDGGQIEEMIKWADGEYGRIDVLVNNAGLASPNILYGGETFDKIVMLLKVNLQAPMEATRLFAKYVREKEGHCGVVINMASMGGLMPNEGGEVYGAAKAGLVHLTRASKSLMPHVRVSAIAPYYVDTPMVRNNPKLQNNPSVFPSLMLSVDQVCASTVACIRDSSAAGKTFALIGSCTYARLWMYDFVGVHIRLLAAWSLLMAAFWKLFGY